jgi:hypothetical protein
VLDFDIFTAALKGDETRLRDEVGPDAIVCVASELGHVFVVRPGEDGRQRGTVGGPGQVADVRLPRTFTVTQVTHDATQFVLTDATGRVARGTPDQFAWSPMILDAEVNPAYDEQLEAVLLDTHRIQHDRETDLDGPRTDPSLSGPEVAELLRVGDATVVDGETELWLHFENAWPEKIEELLPHARTLLAAIDTLGRTGAEFLWNRAEEDEEGEEDEGDLADDEDLDDEDGDYDDEDGGHDDEADEEDADDVEEDDADYEDGDDYGEEASEEGFFELAKPTSLVVYVTGDFAIHYEELSDTYFSLDGYWPAVRFRADGTPVDHYVAA